MNCLLNFLFFFFFLSYLALTMDIFVVVAAVASGFSGLFEKASKGVDILCLVLVSLLT